MRDGFPASDVALLHVGQPYRLCGAAKAPVPRPFASHPGFLY